MHGTLKKAVRYCEQPLANVLWELLDYFSDPYWGLSAQPLYKLAFGFAFFYFLLSRLQVKKPAWAIRK
jgi:hypothetical protein